MLKRLEGTSHSEKILLSAVREPEQNSTFNKTISNFGIITINKKSYVFMKSYGFDFLS